MDAGPEHPFKKFIMRLMDDIHESKYKEFL